MRVFLTPSRLMALRATLAPTLRSLRSLRPTPAAWPKKECASRTTFLIYKRTIGKKKIAGEMLTAPGQGSGGFRCERLPLVLRPSCGLPIPPGSTGRIPRTAGPRPAGDPLSRSLPAGRRRGSRPARPSAPGPPWRPPGGETPAARPSCSPSRSFFHGRTAWLNIP